jgi:hypothetical protein
VLIAIGSYVTELTEKSKEIAKSIGKVTVMWAELLVQYHWQLTTSKKLKLKVALVLNIRQQGVNSSE